MEILLYSFFIAMKSEIERHKWYESEKVGYDVGYEFALVDWCMKHKSDWRLYYMQQLTVSASMQKNG